MFPFNPVVVRHARFTCSATGEKYSVLILEGNGPVDDHTVCPVCPRHHPWELVEGEDPVVLRRVSYTCRNCKAANHIHSVHTGLLQSRCTDCYFFNEVEG